MRAPEAEDLELAALRLDANEGSPAESLPCFRVAEYLRYLAKKQTANTFVQKVATEAGVSPARARESLKRLGLI